MTSPTAVAEALGELEAGLTRAVAALEVLRRAFVQDSAPPAREVVAVRTLEAVEAERPSSEPAKPEPVDQDLERLRDLVADGEFAGMADPVRDGRSRNALLTRERVLEALRATDGSWLGNKAISGGRLSLSQTRQHLPALVRLGLAESNGRPGAGHRYRRPGPFPPAAPKPAPSRAREAPKTRTRDRGSIATAPDPNPGETSRPMTGRDRKIVMPATRPSASIRRPAIPAATPLRQRPDADTVAGVSTMGAAPRQQASQAQTDRIRRVHDERQNGTTTGRALCAYNARPMTVSEVAISLRLTVDEAKAATERLLRDEDIEVCPERRRGFTVYRGSI